MIYSFGDSFTAGLGVDREWEESQLSEHPRWDVMTDDEKNTQRSKVKIFRTKNSYTGQFASKVGIGYQTSAISGCSNVDILNSIFECKLLLIKNEKSLLRFERYIIILISLCL